MKKLMVMTMTSLLALSSIASGINCSFPIGCQRTTNEVLNITQVTEGMIKDFMEGKLCGLIVEFTENSRFPLQLVMKGNLIQLQPEEHAPLYINILKTFYVKCENQDLLFSTDMVEWKSLLDFITGNINCGLSVQQGEPTFTICNEINQRI